MRAWFLVLFLPLTGCLFDDPKITSRADLEDIQEVIAHQLAGTWEAFVDNTTTSVRYYDGDDHWGTEDLVMPNGEWCRFQFTWETALLISHVNFEIVHTVEDIGDCIGLPTLENGQQRIMKIRAKKQGTDELILRIDSNQFAWVRKCDEHWGADICAVGNPNTGFPTPP